MRRFSYFAPELECYNTQVEAGFTISVDGVFEDPKENDPIQWDAEVNNL